MSGSPGLLLRWLTAIRVLPKAAITQLGSRSAPNAQSVLDAGRLAERTFALLDSLDSDVVLLARMGQNLSQFGLTYSHLGYAVRDLRRGEWGIVHLLNAHDADRSGIYQEGLVNFYSDNPYRFEAAALTLPPAVQERLKGLLKTHSKTLHCETYSLTSHPWSLSTQNSNQWVLEVLACAMGSLATPNRQLAQHWLQERGYTPSTLRIGLPTQWAGPLLRDSIRFTDQPEQDRRQGLVRTVTVDSIYDWLSSPTGPLADSLQYVRRIEVGL